LEVNVSIIQEIYGKTTHSIYEQIGHTSMELNKCDCNKTELKDYLLMIKVPIKAIDDIDARMKLSEIKKNPKFYIHNGEIKLQEIFKDQHPRHVRI
jgi:hypothetical protein